MEAHVGQGVLRLDIGGDYESPLPPKEFLFRVSGYREVEVTNRNMDNTEHTRCLSTFSLMVAIKIHVVLLLIICEHACSTVPALLLTYMHRGRYWRNICAPKKY